MKDDASLDMPGNGAKTCQESRVKPAHWLLLVLGLILYVILRLPWVGHLLTWDEAMNLCAIRAFTAGGHDCYSSWFWHHPPLFSALLLLVKPLHAGFAERAELLQLVVGVLHCLVLFSLCRSTLGFACALWAVFFFAVMPAAVFFDLWLKQDTLASLFGMLALTAFLRDRQALSGALLGFALLAKEMAAFYAMGIGALWFFRPRESRKIRDIAAVAVIAALVASWWYLGFSSSIEYFIAFAFNSSGGKDVWVWERPWHYFLGKLHVDLGLLGVVLCIAGVLAIRLTPREKRPAALWPLAVLVPAFSLLCMARGKAIWFTIALYPVFAALQGAGMAGMLQAVRNALSRLGKKWPWIGIGWPRWAVIAAALAVVSRLTSEVWSRDYERYLFLQDGGIWWGAAASRQAAVLMNGLVQDGQKALITPMSYWQYRDKEPCPIFAYYLKDTPVIVRPYDVPAEDFVGVVKKYKIDWAMVSPEGQAGQKALLDPLARQYRLRPVFLRGACIFKTDSIYKEDVRPHSE
jgi:4-amino-4-deoxy-L-arabinose transferase-like glycosyltransferase